MDFGALPPEVNSGRMYLGPGSATLVAASAGWDELAAEMYAAARGCEAMISELTSGSWVGPSSMSMTAAVVPYLVWMRTTAARCDEAAGQAAAAAAAYETAHAMTVPPPLIVANRVRLATLIASNLLGQNTPTIMAAEAEYGEMWAQDAAAMYRYAANSASASSLSVFAPPPHTAKPSGLAAHSTGHSAGAAQTMSRQLIASAPKTLQALASPGSGAAASAAAGGVPPGMGGTPGNSATRAGAQGMRAVSSMASGAMASLLAAGTDSAPELGTNAFGLGSDSFGLGTDISGIGLDLGGSGLELAGGDSLLGAEEAIPSELGAIGAVDGLGPLGDPWAAGVDGGASAGLGQASSLGTLSVPQSWAGALSMLPPHSAGPPASPNGHHGAAGNGHAGTKPPLGGMIAREPAGGAHRVGLRASLIPRSPMAG